MKGEKFFRAVNDTALRFWAEQALPGEPGGWVVLSQVDGFPATEAADDWFGSQEAAEEEAERLAQTAPPPSPLVIQARARK